LTRAWRFKERDVFERLMLSRTAHFAAAAMLSGVTFFVMFIAEHV
jgi:hypothetical protein